MDKLAVPMKRDEAERERQRAIMEVATGVCLLLLLLLVTGAIVYDGVHRWMTGSTTAAVDAG